MMVLDLKGDTFTKEMIWAVMKHAEKHSVTDYLALAGMWEEHDRVLQNEGVWWGPKIRGFAVRVAVCCHCRLHMAYHNRIR